MEKTYRVTFTQNGKKFIEEVEADCKHDAIEFVKEEHPGEDWEAVLVAIDNEYFR